MLLFGLSGFLAGFVGPMVLNPESNIGPLVGVLFSGPAGVVIGRVAGIRFDDKTYNAVADIDLESKYKFPKDSSAKILTSGLLGEQYLAKKKAEAGVESRQKAAA